MDQSAIGADDHRVVAYARLVDPGAWPEGVEPEVNPVTAPRLRFSLEAGYRVACHEGGILDPTDVVGRICLELGIDDGVAPLQTVPGIDPAELASLAAILMGGAEGDRESGDVDQAAETASASSEDDSDEVVLRRAGPAEPDEAVGHEEGDGGDEAGVDEIDPDHDPEAGISHVGDADEGQYHEDR